MKKSQTIFFLFVFLVLLTACDALSSLGLFKSAPPPFSGEQALELVYEQNQLGPRIPGTESHRQFILWAVDKLKNCGWDAELQSTAWKDVPIHNIIAKRGTGEPWIILGAHYDSRPVADHDPDPSKRHLPVPGGNDSASGVAVLLELARSLPEFAQGELWLVFFDAEDSGGAAGKEWILGSRAFVEHLSAYPQAAVIVDMIGDENLTIYQEFNSDETLTQEIWTTAAAMGFESFFPPKKKYRIIDDHLPFIEKGIPAVLLIDFDYPYWHTTEDTPDKVSVQSLQIVGDVLTAWLNYKMR